MSEKEFVPSIIDLAPPDSDAHEAPPKLSFHDRLVGLFNNLRIKRILRRRVRKAVKKRSKVENLAGTKLVRRWFKNSQGVRARTAEEAWAWYNGLYEPKLRAGASRFERERAGL
jgi:predicted metal-dependent hydrolase